MMKKLLPLFLLTTLIWSCSQSPKEKNISFNPERTVCYRAIDGADTGWLKIDTSYKMIKGTLIFNYHNQDRYVGDIDGKIKGDTLIGHFGFQPNGKEVWYKNPIAFLADSGKLKMGVGKFIQVWGGAYFDPAVPIDYEKGRFIFEKEDCKP